MKNDHDAEAVLKSISKILHALKAHGRSSTRQLAFQSPPDRENITKYVKILERRGFIKHYEPDRLASYCIMSTGAVFATNLATLIDKNRLASKKTKKQHSDPQAKDKNVGNVDPKI